MDVYKYNCDHSSVRVEGTWGVQILSDRGVNILHRYLKPELNPSFTI